MRNHRISVLLRKRFTTPNWVKVSAAYNFPACILKVPLRKWFDFELPDFNELYVSAAQGAQRSSYVC